jgi:hypothetical protein
MPNARAPYGRQRATTSLSTDPDRAQPLAPTDPGDQARETSFPQTEARGARKLRAYDGETYYNRPALKPSPYGQLIASYFFVGGPAGAAQLIAGIADVCGRDDDQPVVRAGRYLGLAGILLSPVLLIADLRTPRRWYNMLRIFRRTSAMSIGAWTLTGFGLLSGVAAAAQALYARTGCRSLSPCRTLCWRAGRPGWWRGDNVHGHTPGSHQYAPVGGWKPPAAGAV